MSHAKRIFLPIRQWPAAARTPAALEICAGPIHCLPAVYNNDDAAYRELHFAMPLTDHRLWTATSRDLLPWTPPIRVVSVSNRISNCFPLPSFHLLALFSSPLLWWWLIQVLLRFRGTFFFNLSKGESVCIGMYEIFFFKIIERCRTFNVLIKSGQTEM